MRYGFAALGGTRDVAWHRETTGRVVIHPPPDHGADEWKPRNRVHAVAVADIANQILILASQGATGAIAGLLPQLDAAVANLPPGDAFHWGRNVVEILRREGALDTRLEVAPPAVAMAPGGPVMLTETGDAYPVPLLDYAPPAAGLPWGWIAGGIAALGVGAWLVLR